ncbi:MAG: hypothetical protein ACLP50_11435 [Solirubrobacteraceae bacterium]
MSGSRAVMAAGVIALALATAGGASAHTATAQLGQVSATFTYSGSFPNFSDEVLTITTGGRQVYDRLVSSTFCDTCAPSSVTESGDPVQVLDLESDGRPDVVLGLYSGGAHCCFIDQVFSYDPRTMTYVESEHDFADAGAAITRRDGRYVFMSADLRFAYVFTDYADNGAPLQIWRFSSRRFIDITRRFPALIRRDAAGWLKSFKSDLRNGEGFLAAWAADEELLGNRGLVSSTLQIQLREGHLESSLADFGAPTGRSFITALMKLLRRYGYVR